MCFLFSFFSAQFRIKCRERSFLEKNEDLPPKKIIDTRKTQCVSEVFFFKKPTQHSNISFTRRKKKKMLRRSFHCFCSSSPHRQHSKIIIWGTFGAAPARRLKPTELILTNLPPQDQLNSSWNFVACSAGSRHIALLTQEGHIVLVGSNKHGQLGRDTAENIPENEPQYFDLDFQNPEKEKPNAITCGTNYTIAYRRVSQNENNGNEEEETNIRAVVVGYNNAGQLGLGHKEILDNRDGVAEWRPNAKYWFQHQQQQQNSEQKNKAPLNVSHIECGYNHTFAIMKDKSKIFSFGTNQWGELGLGRSITDSPMTPTLVPFFAKNSEQHEIADIRCGNSFSVFLTKVGRVFACGTGARGQLPFAVQEPTVYPVQRDARPVLMRVSNISCGSDHVVFVTRSRDKEKEELFNNIDQQEEENAGEDADKNISAKIKNADKFYKFYNYEIFFKGSMPDIGIVNATGTMQRVELGFAQPPFQYVKSHASSTILIDKNGDFFGLGANPEGQLGLWEQSESEERNQSEQFRNNDLKKKDQKLLTSLRGEEFATRVLRKQSQDDAKRKETENEDGSLKAPEGFGIVYNENIPSAFELHSSRFVSSEMPMLAVQFLRKIDGLQRKRKTPISSSDVDESEDNYYKEDTSIVVGFDAKVVSSSSDGENSSSAAVVVREWRDRLGFGNGFGILLDNQDEYDVSMNEPCRMPPPLSASKRKKLLQQQQQDGSSSSPKRKLTMMEEKEEMERRRKKKRQNLQAKLQGKL